MKNEIRLPWLLVATPQLTDENFRKAVVLIVEYSEQGAMGFVINRPIGQSLSDLVDMEGIEVPSEIPAWFGGPVSTDNGIILHNRPEIETDDPSFSQHIALSASEKTFIEMVKDAKERLAEIQQSGQLPQADSGSPPSLYPYRFLVGYAGWGPGQLEEEIREGAWLQTPFDDELMFKVKWSKIWDKAMEKTGVKPSSLLHVHHEYLN